jgi:hypothetical protein
MERPAPIRLSRAARDDVDTAGPFHYGRRCHGRPVTAREIENNIRGDLCRHIVVDSLHRLHIDGRLAAAATAALTLARKARGWQFRSPLAGPARLAKRLKPF